MGSLATLLNLTQGSLDANQAAIDITSTNVANANTPGYTRELAVWQEQDRVSLSGGSSVGSGATVTDVAQRDRVLDQRVQQQTQAQTSASAVADALTQLQTVFGISSTSTSASSTAIGSAVDSFFNSLSSLQSSPSSASLRQAVLSAAQTLVSSFNTASSQILQQTSSINQQVVAAVTQVNSLAASIASLNAQIQAISPNQDAGTLEDQRQQDITQLSQYVGLDQTTTENNGISLTMNGAPLVSGTQSYAFSTAQVGGNTNVFSAPPGSTDITSGVTGGQLGGILQVRDQSIPQFSASLDALAYSIGNAVNTQNAAGLDAGGNPGVALFTLPSTAAGAASTISLATSDPNAIAAAAVGEGASGGSNALALSDLANTPNVNGETPSGYFASFLSQLGNAVSSATDSNTVQQASLTQLTTQQSSLSSVSLDDEASNLTQYQRSYEAAAKVFSIVDELFASALNLGEQTTVS